MALYSSKEYSNKLKALDCAGNTDTGINIRLGLNSSGDLATLKLNSTTPHALICGVAGGNPHILCSRNIMRSLMHEYSPEVARFTGARIDVLAPTDPWSLFPGNISRNAEYKPYVEKLPIDTMTLLSNQNYAESMSPAVRSYLGLGAYKPKFPEKFTGWLDARQQRKGFAEFSEIPKVLEDKTCIELILDLIDGLRYERASTLRDFDCKDISEFNLKLRKGELNPLSEYPAGSITIPTKCFSRVVVIIEHIELLTGGYSDFRFTYSDKFVGFILMKLSELIKKCDSAGIHFVLIGNKYTDIERLGFINQRVALYDNPIPRIATVLSCSDSVEETEAIWGRSKGSMGIAGEPLAKCKEFTCGMGV